MNAGNPNQTSELIRNRVLFILPVAAFGVLNLFLFIPVTIYKGNTAEFVTSFNSILPYLSTPALISFIALFIVGVVLPRSLRLRYGSIIFVLGLLLWLQGNILNWKYGLFDGQGIDWSIDVWRGYLDITIWIVLLAASLIFHKKVCKIAPIASGALIVMQTAFLAQAYIQVPELRNITSSDFVLKDDVYEFSSTFNIIHVILDAFQSDIFEEIITEDPDKYYNILEGFTFFRDTTGSFPTTLVSIPSIFSAQVYKNDIPMQVFIDQVMEGENLPNLLYEKGYKVDRIHVGAKMYEKGKYTNYNAVKLPPNLNDMMKDIEEKDTNTLITTALMADLALFRIAPHFIKKEIYNDQEWFLQQLFLKWFSQRMVEEKWTNVQGQFLIPFVSRVFLKDYISKMSVNKKKPVYKFLHLKDSHAPWVMDANCEYAGKVNMPVNEKLTGKGGALRERIRVQQRCALDNIIEFMEKLKELGIYDSSLIILNADHGANAEVEMTNLIRTQGAHVFNQSGAISNRTELGSIVGAAMPLLLIKPPLSKSPLKVSNAQVELTDIPATVLSLLDMEQVFDGRSAFKITPDEARERRFYWHRWEDKNWESEYFDFLGEYIIKGSVRDADSWRRGKVYFNPNISFSETRKIDFGTKKSTPHLYSGWSWNEIHVKKDYTYNWALGHTSSVFLALPKNKPVIMTARIIAFGSKKLQNVTVRVDGKVVGRWEDVKSGMLTYRSVIIPPSRDRPKVSVVEFTYTYNRVPKIETRPLAVAFESITISDINP